MNIFLNILKLILLEIPSLNHNIFIVQVRKKLKQLSDETSFFKEYTDHILELGKKKMANRDLDDIEKSKK